MSVTTLAGKVVLHRGQSYQSALLDEPGPHLLGLGTIARNGGFNGSSLRTYGGASPERILLRPGDLYLSLKDVTHKAELLGAVSRVPSTVPLGRLTQDTVRLQIVDPCIDAMYLYWLLQSPTYRAYCRAHGTGTTNLDLSRNDFLAFEFRLPPLPEQQAIAEVLGALDDKIAANVTKVTLLLEVVSAEFTKRFGDRRLDIELGTLAEIVDCLHSKKPERVSAGRMLMQLNNIRDDGLVDDATTYSIAEQDYDRWSARFETRAWDFVITNVGRIGAVARIPVGYVAALGRNMTGIRPRDADESGSFIAAALLSSAVRREIEQRTDAGSVMNALNVRSIPLLRLQESSAVERATFHEVAAPLLESADTTLAENRALAAARDALLPKLMSGALRVKDAAKITEEAGL
ncbi:type I restriction enzyme S subunit [Microbacterium sp. W4I4]|uniref:restriction endonuclease subunit S n=1 Tax=Microbacterium sp. W4I4 TaxID=3042295 RepID=UPI0027810E41|nr:restriction endonuclease subunit S [Microbacterium sp. W4I4]MDQ0613480.1 type I restriction enzyme S subunit [Microbacterium sp. W4I4]